MSTPERLLKLLEHMTRIRHQDPVKYAQLASAIQIKILAIEARLKGRKDNQ